MTVKKTFPGTLFLVVGNSGSGKDSIISGAIDEFPNDLKEPRLAKRYITRPPSEFEDNYAITEEKFKEMQKNGEFALKWHIYHLYYGVPIEIDDWLKEGHPVIVNVSRTIVDEARECYANIKVIFIKVPFEITLERIKDRGREKGKLLEERIERAKTHQKFPKADYVVDNSGDLKDAIDQFLDYILKVIKTNNS
ncbi:MAG: phosphonate metabolism protein/1,5-bisphosphokinase (PRPP-forming) PhnN [Promethearchaeota archaeon]|nr:MAG: phosphonate metabolism protein/1,5-bisphosphokinase (PRPP-forming) PhnN [Candidatus Lokiarchaeota archaeon]